MTNDSWIKKVSFILAIVILFVAVVQVGLNTFWPNPEYPMSDCYLKTASEPDEACIAEDRIAQEKYQESQDGVNRIKFIIGTIISLIAVLLVLFVKFNESIIYGLFSGAIFNMLFTLGFARDKNLFGFIALLALFVIVIFFVQRKSKK